MCVCVCVHGISGKCVPYFSHSTYDVHAHLRSILVVDGDEHHDETKGADARLLCEKLKKMVLNK